MSHEHAHHHGADRRRLALALALSLLILATELAGAWWSASLALLSDAAHMFTDAAALAIALVATTLARRPADRKRSFGYGRFEIIAALVNALLLLGAAAYIVWEAWRRVRDPVAIGWDAMLVVAVVGLVANVVSLRLLSGSHEHNLNMRGAYLEVWSDTLGSVGVIAAAGGIWLTGWRWLDSAVAIGIGLWVLPRTWALLRTSMNVLLEGVPHDVDTTSIEQALLRCDGVASLHDLHVWSIGTAGVSLTVHVVTAPATPPGDSLLARLRAMLAAEFGIHHSTVQLETEPCEQARETHGFGPSAEPPAHRHVEGTPDDQRSVRERELDRQRSSLARRLESALRTPMAVLGFAWLVLLIVDLTRGLGPLLSRVSVVIWAVFVLDFLLRFAIAPNKIGFLRRNVLTLLSLLLPALRIARLARLARGARALRGVKLVKLFGALNGGMRAARRILRRRGFGYVLLLTVLVMLGGSAGMYALEPAGLPDFGTALWWTAMLLVTMGSDWWPRTPEGRLLCLALALYGFSVFGYITAAMASVFVASDSGTLRR